MDLNDLLAEIDGIGGDRFIPSGKAPAEVPAPAPADDTAEVPAPAPAAAAPVLAAVLPAAPTAPALGSLDMVLDVELELTVELGQTRLPLKRLMEIQPDDEFLLEQRPDDPLRLYVNDRLVALGEALVVDGMLAVKVTELLTQGEAPA